ncbi:MAG: ATP-dependent helicase [Desulfobulbaceae bacterium]|nr:ATP-dependent helicase [Desulfobulbaceae bacterium]
MQDHSQHNILTEVSKQEESPVTREALNEAQYKAVTHGNGPVLVIAGAGSGKTRTLVYRMAYLIEQGIPPESIMLLTFTRRSAQEMLYRATQLTNQSCRRVIGGTFHATSNMLLRQHGHHLGFPPGFTIIDRGDAEGIINLIKSSLDLAGAGKRFPSKRIVMNLLSGAINKARPIEDLVFESHIHLSEFIDDFHTIRDHYNQFKLDHGLMDYDDLLVNWQRLLAESDAAGTEISQRFQYILVDEYQDTNLVQAEIVRLLARNHDNVMVVGDDAQSIYSFRGADFYNIMRFPDQFPGTRVIKLEQNYRSTQPILSLTNAIIEQAEEKFTKTLFTEIEGGIQPEVFSGATEAAEARFVVDTIDRLIKDGTQKDSIAILFRSGFHSYKLEMELTSRYIEFEKRGGLKLTESAHTKDALSFLRILVNPWDNLSWNRILLQLDKVGPKTAQKILVSISETDDPIAALATYKPAPGWKQGYTKLLELLVRLKGPGLTPGGQFDLIMEYYQPILEKIYHDDYPKRSKELEHIRALIGDYGDLQSFVDDTALDPPEISAADQAPTPEDGRLILSTIHSAKGLEWDAVFVIGLAEGRFPHQNAVPGEQYEEERRLLYVAATRAKKQLFLTYPRQLMTPDRKFRHTVMSPFLREINPGLYHQQEMVAPTPYSFSDSSGFGLPDPVGTRKKTVSARVEYSPGMLVQHALFGPGRVKSIPGPRRVEISFDRHGDKVLHLDYAKLEVI